MKQKKLITLLAMCSILTLTTANPIYAETTISSELSENSSEAVESPAATEAPAITETPNTTEATPSPAAASVTPGSSQADAGELTIGTKITATAESNTHSWFSFTTDDVTAYNITLTNHSPNTDSLEWYLYDEYGTQIGDRMVSGTNGVPATMYAQELESNTSYYISVSPWSSESTDYSLVVQDPENSVTSDASDNLTPAEGNAAPGISPDDAQILSSGSKITGTIEEHTTAWFGFHTDDSASCNISIINTSSDTDSLELHLYDQYGAQIGDRLIAGTDGVPATFFTADMDLEPNTTYYFSVSPWGSDTDYTISVKSPNA